MVKLMIDQVKEDFRSRRWNGMFCIAFSLILGVGSYHYGMSLGLGRDILIVSPAVILMFLLGAWLLLPPHTPRVRIQVTNTDLVVLPDNRDAQPVRLALAHLTTVTASSFVRYEFPKLRFHAGGSSVEMTVSNLTHGIDDIISMISARLSTQRKDLFKDPQPIISGGYASWYVADLE